MYFTVAAVQASLVGCFNADLNLKTDEDALCFGMDYYLTYCDNAKVNIAYLLILTSLNITYDVKNRFKYEDQLCSLAGKNFRCSIIFLSLKISRLGIDIMCIQACDNLTTKLWTACNVCT